MEGGDRTKAKQSVAGCLACRSPALKRCCFTLTGRTMHNSREARVHRRKRPKLGDDPDSRLGIFLIKYWSHFSHLQVKRGSWVVSSAFFRAHLCTLPRGFKFFLILLRSYLEYLYSTFSPDISCLLLHLNQKQNYEKHSCMNVPSEYSIHLYLF